ncbi:CotY/CotZ family spore coat protein [Aquibacillus halophilus]|uniref:CotY/CotZ family spore coat protein n=1 Tax=Aquibacillus halophilus TaxID=930132 RepID=UPI001478D55D|nr:CotY/CotZ family spore coat protein [Aquibacillus halophilus]
MDGKEKKFEDELENNHDDKKKCEPVSCICEILSDILKKQKDSKGRNRFAYDLQGLNNVNHSKVIPFILQTPYGHPYFTWGKVGTEDCFVTVFFKVVKIDCDKNCAVLQLLKPDVSIVDSDTKCVETENICDVDFLIPTKECVLVDLSCYTAVKFMSPSLVKNMDECFRNRSSSSY